MTVFDILVNYHVAFLQGLGVTIKLCLIIWSVGIVGGIILGVAGAYRRRTWGRFIRGMSFGFSAIPTLVVLFWLHYPAQAAFNVVIDPFYTAAFTLSLVNIFGVGENVRQAIVDFPRQYILAGRVCGMTTPRIVRYIQLPILFRKLLPTMLILQVGMLHASLFASLISVEEIFRVAQRINSAIYRPSDRDLHSSGVVFPAGVSPDQSVSRVSQETLYARHVGAVTHADSEKHHFRLYRNAHYQGHLTCHKTGGNHRSDRPQRLR